MSEQAPFRDAQAMARAHPLTFEVPEPERLAALRAGDFVKVCASNERFWVVLTARYGDGLVGKVNNDLIWTDDHGLSCDDEVRFTTDHVYDVITAAELVERKAKRAASA